MLLRFIRGTALGGVGNDAETGSVREIADAQALALIARGRAVRHVAASIEQAPEPAATPAPSETKSRAKPKKET